MNVDLGEVAQWLNSPATPIFDTGLAPSSLPLMIREHPEDIRVRRERTESGEIVETCYIADGRFNDSSNCCT